jgi:hypothetical protein
MLIDCDRCEMCGIACPDCVVTALLGGTARHCGIGEDEGRALRVLADAKLVAPPALRRAPAVLPRAS